ncbi:hypothetical protein B296_00043062 [Ensete ventricosum]|uniref:Uncharacterized protein n=1 Tax=Ensete ventricosum TaxID=4639 RepID=A0A426ZG80_ENSVE|nr:hypothetical protein B296_00043062 [Ensete ventricosum]
MAEEVASSLYGVAWCACDTAFALVAALQRGCWAYRWHRLKWAVAALHRGDGLPYVARLPTQMATTQAASYGLSLYTGDRSRASYPCIGSWPPLAAGWSWVASMQATLLPLRCFHSKATFAE